MADACAENEEAKREGRGDDEGREEDAQPARTILTRGPLRSQRGENTHPFGGYSETQTLFVLVYSSIECTPSSRPNPDCL